MGATDIRAVLLSPGTTPIDSLTRRQTHGPIHANPLTVIGRRDGGTTPGVVWPSQIGYAPWNFRFTRAQGVGVVEPLGIVGVLQQLCARIWKASVIPKLPVAAMLRSRESGRTAGLIGRCVVCAERAMDHLRTNVRAEVLVPAASARMSATRWLEESRELTEHGNRVYLPITQ